LRFTFCALRFTPLLTFNLQLSTFAQGNLTPPGPPGPLMKSLDQIEARTSISSTPYTITNSGSYYLVSNLAASGSGILIAADNVSIDLNGFTIRASGPSTGPGIGVNSNHANLWIGNGVVRDFNGFGLNVSGALNARIENVRVFNNTNFGLQAGDKALVIGCLAASNYVGGISLGASATIKDSTASGNGQFGISVGDNSLVLNCNASYNGSNGISTGKGTVISQCTASQNAAIGINASSGCTVSDCAVYLSHGAGISAVDGSIIRHCSAYYGDGDGIVVSFGCQVLNNMSFQNGTGTANAGIRCTSRRNRVEGNNVANNLDKGIDCGTITPNVIVKNSSGSNGGGNYVNTAGNDVGPIGSAAASTSPWANISY
jgi:hypothetical protein